MVNILKSGYSTFRLDLVIICMNDEITTYQYIYISEELWKILSSEIAKILIFYIPNEFVSVWRQSQRHCIIYCSIYYHVSTISKASWNPPISSSIGQLVFMTRLTSQTRKTYNFWLYTVWYLSQSPVLEKPKEGRGWSMIPSQWRWLS
jgi:hypothetical protein